VRSETTDWLLAVASVVWPILVVLVFVGSLLGDCAADNQRCLAMHEHAFYVLPVGFGLQIAATLIFARKRMR